MRIGLRSVSTDAQSGMVLVPAVSTLLLVSLIIIRTGLAHI